MPTYAIGDLQGCCQEFEALLRLISFDAAHDTVWLVGDLINRGPESLATLRAVMALGERAVVVLGNHDIHLLAAYAKLRKPGKNDTLGDILSASDVADLIDWLRHRPMAHRDAVGGQQFLMVHAGLLPSWSADRAVTYAQEIEAVLRSDDWTARLGGLFGNQPSQWHESLSGENRLRCIINVLTRLRFCDADDDMDFSANGDPGAAPAGFAPWFQLRPKNQQVTVVTGHWSALGLRLGDATIATDSGCVWGGALSAVRLDDMTIFQQPCTRFVRVLES